MRERLDKVGMERLSIAEIGEYAERRQRHPDVIDLYCPRLDDRRLDCDSGVDTLRLILGAYLGAPPAEVPLARPLGGCLAFLARAAWPAELVRARDDVGHNRDRAGPKRTPNNVVPDRRARVTAAHTLLSGGMRGKGSAQQDMRDGALRSPRHEHA